MSRIARRQWGVISRNQLIACGLSNAAIARWTRNGRLRRVHPGVYALGQMPLGTEGRLAAALLYAGAGAALSHESAAWVWGLLSTQPPTIDISTTRRIASVPGVRAHCRRQIERIRRGRFPVTTVPQTLLDLASSLPYRDLRRALAQADYRRLLDPPSIQAALGSGRPGSRNLRRALDDHQPLLARAASDGEELLIELCEANEIPLPELNVPLGGFKVDALWREQRLVVEVDSGAAHGTPAQMEADRNRDLVLRAAGYRVVRYTWHQLTKQPKRVVDDLCTQLFQAVQ